MSTGDGTLNLEISPSTSLYAENVLDPVLQTLQTLQPLLEHDLNGVKNSVGEAVTMFETQFDDHSKEIDGLQHKLQILSTKISRTACNEVCFRMFPHFKPDAHHTTRRQLAKDFNV
jgi:hypothetical protein